MPADPFTISTVLVLAAKKVLETLSSKLSEELCKKLKGDAAQKAFAQALGIAVSRYALSAVGPSSITRLELAGALSRENGPFEDKDVAYELAQILIFDSKPNATRIGEIWKQHLPDMPNWVDFTRQAELLLEHLQNALRDTDVYRNVFESKDLNGIQEGVTRGGEQLTEISSQLMALANLLTTNFGELARAFSKINPSIGDQIRDFTLRIYDRTQGFVGRKFVFNALDEFLNKNDSGYFIVRGHPGIGKTSISAQLVRTRGYVHHFNIRAEGINRPDSFLRNVCAQLVAAYNLTHDAIPVIATQDGGFLGKLLQEVSERLLPSSKAVLVVDALDEVDDRGILSGTNPLYLPMLLPPRIYIVTTTRRGQLNFRIESPSQTLDLEQDSSGNIADVQEYIRRAFERPSIKRYAASHQLNDAQFIELLVAKSQGNFMYLHYVLPEIEGGYYKDLALDEIPSGLKNYYEDHWSRMKGQNADEWFKYKLPVVMALTVAKEAISIERLEYFSDVDRPRIRAVIEEWRPFLDEELVSYQGGIQKRFRIYDDSFHDLIAAKEEVSEPGVNRQKAHEKIAHKLLDELPFQIRRR